MGLLSTAGGLLFGLRSMRLPQHGSVAPLASQSLSEWPLPEVSHVRSPRSGVPLPPKSYVIRMSPSVRLIVRSPGWVKSPELAFWSSSKSMFALPFGFGCRSQAR